MIYLHKILPLFFMPIMLLLVAMFICIKKGYKKLSYVFLALFYISATPVFSNFLFKRVEGEYLYQNMEAIENVDAIVVLSGMLRINEFENSIKIEWEDIDRFFGGIDLYKAKKSNTLVFTGGKSPYNITHISEGEILKDYAIKFGVCEQDIRVTKEVLNTYEESLAVAELIGKNKTILLVTSAYHMKRAKGLFEKQGVFVIPYKVDFKVPPKPNFYLIDILPSAIYLKRTEVALREVLGRLYYEVFWF